MDIGSKIKTLRKERGLTQSELARRSGLAQSAISYIETEGKKPNITTISLIAEALGVSPASFFNPDIQEPPKRGNQDNQGNQGNQIKTHNRLKEETLPLALNNMAKQDLEFLLEQDNIWFNGIRLSDEDKNDILNVLRLIWKGKNAPE